MSVEIKKFILTQNPCYTKNEKIDVKGIFLHSVGCPQPNANVFIRSWNKSSYSSACVHGFIDANTGEIYQTLPWDHRGWHCGKGENGSGNNTHIGIEMCEPACIKYTSGANFECYDKNEAVKAAKRTYASAIKLFAYLCKLYDLDPLKDGVILGHKEGYYKGIASGHGDPSHLWEQLDMTGYSMDNFRRAVKQEMPRIDIKVEHGNEVVVDKGSSENLTGSNNEEKIWNYLYSKIGNVYGVSGLMGNLFAESGLLSNNLQNTYNKKLGYSDEEYTKLVDSGEYNNFIKDSAGYGLAQWTYWSRKQNLYNYLKDKGLSIGDLGGQLEFLIKELSESYSSVFKALKTATDVRSASDIVLTKFEKPADMGEATQKKRSSYGVTYYTRYVEATKLKEKEELDSKEETKEESKNNNSVSNSASNITIQKKVKYTVYVGKYFVKANANQTLNRLNKLEYDGIIKLLGMRYSIQVGVFNVKSNAEKMVKDLKTKGITARIEEE